jgi:LemA protein
MRTIVILVVLAVLALLMLNGCSTYNSFVDNEAEVEKQWANVQSAYQERADLVPNLVATVKGAADFEKSTLTQITEARARATSVNIDPSKISPEKLAEFQQAQGELSSALGRLLMVTENYPELKANANFRDLQAQLEGMENRIRVERNKFNEKTAEYNKLVKRFPGTFYASVFGFDSKPLFEADQSAQNAPKVEF